MNHGSLAMEYRVSQSDMYLNRFIKIVQFGHKACTEVPKYRFNIEVGTCLENFDSFEVLLSDNQG